MSQSVVTPQLQFSWGDALVVATFKAPGGLNVAVSRIRAEAGPQIGVRNTFAKLLHVTDVSSLRGRDQLRAWLLLVALGQEPRDWGLTDDVVPPAYDVDRLRASLRSEDVMYP